MTNTYQHLQTSLFSTGFRQPIVFRTASLPAQASYPRHRHAWGEFVYAYNGVMEIKLTGHHYLAPPQYGIWLPPDVEHVGFNRHAACHCSLYLAPELCAVLPAAPCALTVSPLVRAILDALRGDALQDDALRDDPLRNDASVAPTGEHGRLLQVLVDQLARSPHAGSYLPSSSDALLGPVLMALEADPGDARSLPQLAHAANTTERTLMRRCQRDLGMTFIEWRQRLKVLKALALLEQGWTVESIGLHLGYSSASAFIGMFRKMMGTTPDEYRKNNMTAMSTG
jgi:AraC-like DNA-binding protein